MLHEGTMQGSLGLSALLDPPAETLPVHLSDWEHNKENVLPSTCGRDPAVLAKIAEERSTAAVAPTGFHEDHRLRKRTEFEQRLAAVTTASISQPVAMGSAREFNIDKLVSLWSEYAHWTAEWFPSDSHQERMVLERATRYLAGFNECRENLEHLKLWLRLANLLQEPQEVFNFLWSREIGTIHAAYYASWCLSLERQERFGEAEEALNVGIARGAQPVEQLKNMRATLALRMHERIRQAASNAEAAQDGFYQHNEEPYLKRIELNEMTAAEARHSHRPTEKRRFQSSQLITPAIMAGRQQHKVEQPSVFDGLAEEYRASIFDAAADWSLPPPFQVEAAKENSRMPVLHPWSQSRFRQRGTVAHTLAATRQAPIFSIFMDDDLTPAKGEQTPSVGSRMRRDGAWDAIAGVSPAFNMLESSTARVLPAPGAPERGVRRRRHEPAAVRKEPMQELTSSLSCLRIQDEPPSKRTCVGTISKVFIEETQYSSSSAPRAREINSGENDISSPDSEVVQPLTSDSSSEEATANCVHTPTRPRSSLRARLFGDSAESTRFNRLTRPKKRETPSPLGVPSPPQAPTPHSELHCPGTDFTFGGVTPSPRRMLGSLMRLPGHAKGSRTLIFEDENLAY